MSREPFVTAVTLDLPLTDNKFNERADRSTASINTSQLLSNKMYHEYTQPKANPFQTEKSSEKPQKPQTSLEVYSRTLKQPKGKNSDNSHQRNWSGIYAEEGKSSDQLGDSSTRNELKNSYEKEGKLNHSSLVFKKHFSDVK